MYTDGEDSEDTVSYGDFLSLARDEGLIALEVLVVQAPAEGNGRTAVVQAVARTAEGSFGAVGEASPASAPAAWHPFLTTLAELRAKARALREMTNNFEHAVQEELAVPYRVAGDGDGGDGPDGRRVRESSRSVPARSVPQTAPAAPTALVAFNTDETPVELSSIPGLQRGAGGLKSTTRLAPSPSPAVPVPSPRPAPRMDEDEADEEDMGDTRNEDRGNGGDEGDEDDEEGLSPLRTPTPLRVTSPASAPSAPHLGTGSAPSRAPAPAPSSSDADGPPDYDAIPPDMLDKLKRLAVSIADLEGTELSDAQAILKLDDFFMRAFRHPLGKATRIEGSRVVQKLSSDLSKRRAALNEDNEDE